MRHALAAVYGIPEDRRGKHALCELLVRDSPQRGGLLEADIGHRALYACGVPEELSEDAR